MSGARSTFKDIHSEKLLSSTTESCSIIPIINQPQENRQLTLKSHLSSIRNVLEKMKKSEENLLMLTKGAPRKRSLTLIFIIFILLFSTVFIGAGASEIDENRSSSLTFIIIGILVFILGMVGTYRIHRMKDPLLDFGDKGEKNIIDLQAINVELQELDDNYFINLTNDVEEVESDFIKMKMSLENALKSKEMDHHFAIAAINKLAEMNWFCKPTEASEIPPFLIAEYLGYERNEPISQSLTVPRFFRKPISDKPKDHVKLELACDSFTI